MSFKKLDLCIANVAGVVDPYNEAGWTKAKALKLDADIAAVLESPRRSSPERTALRNAYERGMFTRGDLLNARRVLANWLASLHDKRLTGGSPPTRMEKEIVASPAALGEVQAVLDAFWSLHDEVPARVRIEVGIAAAEIAANILEHGCAISLRMELGITPNEVHVEFTDGGDPVAVDLNSVCMPDGMAERGRGLALAQAAMSLLSYCRDEAGNHWRLVSNAFSNHRA